MSMKKNKARIRKKPVKHVDFNRHIKSAAERDRHRQYKLYIIFSAIVLVLVLIYQMLIGG